MNDTRTGFSIRREPDQIKGQNLETFEINARLEELGIPGLSIAFDVDAVAGLTVGQFKAERVK